jgi:hypothetical protein
VAQAAAKIRGKEEERGVDGGAVVLWLLASALAYELRHSDYLLLLMVLSLLSLFIRKHDILPPHDSSTDGVGHLILERAKESDSESLDCDSTIGGENILSYSSSDRHERAGTARHSQRAAAATPKLSAGKTVKKKKFSPPRPATATTAQVPPERPFPLMRTTTSGMEPLYRRKHAASANPVLTEWKR